MRNMNSDFACERFNLPKAEVLDRLVRSGRSFGVHWWTGTPNKRSPAYLTSVGRLPLGRVLAPSLSDLDWAVRKAGAVATDMSLLPSNMGERYTQLKKSLVTTFRAADIIFIDPDTGIRNVGPATYGKYILPCEVKVASQSKHLLIYQHLGRVIDKKKDTPQRASRRVKKALGSLSLSGVRCWERSGVECIIVWVPRQRYVSAALCPFPRRSRNWSEIQ